MVVILGFLNRRRWIAVAGVIVLVVGALAPWPSVAVNGACIAVGGCLTLIQLMLAVRDYTQRAGSRHR